MADETVEARRQPQAAEQPPVHRECVCGHTVWRHDGGRCRDCYCAEWRPLEAGGLSRPECVFRCCPKGNCQGECLHYSLPGGTP